MDVIAPYMVTFRPIKFLKNLLHRLLNLVLWQFLQNG